MKDSRWRHAITAEEHAVLEGIRGRPLTDDPIGTWSAAQRAEDATASAAFDETDLDRTITLGELVEQRRRRT